MNGRQMRNKRAIEDDFKEKIGRSWWGAVQYSITYFGLCAPIAYTYNSTEILQAASFTPNSTYPDSQMPVRGLKWADTECKVDGIELSRQEKVDLIAEEVEGEDWTQLNVCEKTTESESDHLNCSQCAKCVRTIMGLYIAGVDPAKYGFKEDLSSLELIQTGFESKTIQLKPYGLEMFQDMQKKIDNDRIMKENSEEFVGWFKQYEFEKNLRTPSIKRRVYQTAPNPFDRWLKRVYETIQSRRS